MRNAFTDREATSTTQTYAELHDDGSSVLAFPVASTPTEYDGRKEPRSAIKATYVQVVCASAVVLADAWLMTQRITAEASMLASIVTSPVDTEPVWAISDVPGGRARILPTTRPLTRILPVDTFLAFPRDLPRMRAAAMDLAESILHQFGIEHLNQLALPED
ncbi:hypothetical protein H9623_19050 [Oerskovia sp. Sa1BUA8]|uniref:Uncharacterized protein n=1 Tax=Oerskovia douganii TaxID=2762210 RepID=A0A9D5UE90_9CELL|nr:hypothetical protein [Oerskovia douganii]MBE7702391.1 hypothetical protein [Oerskovia douganii]